MNVKECNVYKKGLCKIKLKKDIDINVYCEFENSDKCYNDSLQICIDGFKELENAQTFGAVCYTCKCTTCGHKKAREILKVLNLI